MEIIQVTGLPPQSDEPMVLCIGKFDGVHIGHQKILETAKGILGTAKLAVMSFWPHPAFVFGRGQGYDRAITPMQEKARQLSAEGVQRLYAVEFSLAYSDIAAETFVHEHLGRLRLNGLVVGTDFRFGKGGTGTAQTLTALCNPLGIPVYIVQPVEENGVKVSSSQIREHLEQGRLEAAEALLGRPYTVEGVVVHGDARGRLLGFPTANMGLSEPYVLPASGVYAASVAIRDSDSDREEHWFGVLNAGVRPTVAGKEFRIEVHLIDFDGDLYGKRIRVSFLRRVREERRFESLDALQTQIGLDTAFVRQVFLG